MVSDFGISRQIEDNVALRTQIGSLGYMSPEQCDPRNGYDEKVDIWAVGVIAYILSALWIYLFDHLSLMLVSLASCHTIRVALTWNQ